MNKFVLLLIVLINISCSYNLQNNHTFTTGISGIVVDENKKPVPNAYVYLYRTISSGLMGPADFMEKTDDKGSFFFDVPEGKYFLVVRKRASGLDSGPLRQGDRSANYSKNPINLNQNEIKNIEVILPSKTQIFQKKMPVGETSITIKLIGEGVGKKKFYILIYEGEKEKKSPDYIQETIADNININLPLNKVFNIIVRESMKDKIERNELYGKFGPLYLDGTKEITIEIERHK